jgi:hypothetical protein
MSHHVHEQHDHTHGPGCGHPSVQHGDHIDYLHDGHLHRAHDGHYDECALEVGPANPADCAPHDCAGHDAAHQHGPDCGHPAVPHGDHVDYLVDGHLHHPHNGHCDHHGAVALV